MNKLKIVSILKVFYYMLPKFIRVQYSDSVTVLRNMALGDKSLHNDFFVENKIKLVKELESLGATFDIITHIIGRKNIIGAPAIYIDNVRCFRPSLEGGLLDVKVIHLFHVTLIGSTDGVIYKDKMYHQELLSMRHTNDLKQPDIFVSQNFVKIHNYDYLVRSRKNVLNIEGPAISLLKEHSSNYYHCVTEILPKLQQILSCVPSNKDSFSILIDDCMPIQVVNMINVILSAYTCFQYELIKVEKGQKVNCNEVIYCTPLWLSLDNTQYLPDPKNEFFVSVDSLKKLKGHISSVLFAPTVSSKYRKVYLQNRIID
ncbi:hypothetical protein ACP3XC_05870 [Vibrio anguillarum]|uniref:hypothetical protein n=1 Tax=Vibrio anguillarum TaxID=55601 RepID=UPI003CECC395